MTPEENLTRQVEAASHPAYLKSKSEIVEYYRDTYGKGWKQKIVHDLSDITGLKPKNLERRFDPSRLNVVPRTAKAKAEYEALGKTLGVQHYEPPPGGYTVFFDMLIRISKDCYPRSKTMHVTGADAYLLANDPSFASLFLIYFGDQDTGEDYCGDPVVSITAA